MSTNETAIKAPKEQGPIARVLAPIRNRLIISSLLAAIGSILMLAPLAGIAKLAMIAFSNDLAPSQALAGEVWPVITYSLISLFVGLIINTLAEVLVHFADNSLIYHLRVEAIKRLSQVPLGWFSSRASGEVKQAMQDDIETLHDLTAHFFTSLARAIGVLVFAMAYLFVMNWKIALVTLIPFAIFFLLYSRAFKAGGEYMGDFIGGMMRIDNSVVEFVNAIPVIKTFSTTGQAHDGYRNAVNDFSKAFLKLSGAIGKSIATANAIVSPLAILGVVLAFGTLFVWFGWTEPIDVIPFALVAPAASAPLLMITFITHGLRNATGAAERIHALLQTPVLSQPEKLAHSLDKADINIEQVSYGYTAEKPVLENINLALQPGSVTAVVGPSGAGKSTLARLMLRFFDPTEGRITYAGVNLRDIPSHELYQRIGFVLQEVRLIHASVRDNIALGRPTASQQDIEAVARDANIHERIMQLPRGYDSVIGEDALLSGGEEQRISIARAMLLNPEVLVLDEATAAADAESEAAIQEALSRFAKGRTLLVIAHRLDTIMGADQIVVIDEGTIVEKGKHDELLAKEQHYARLWKAGGYSQSQDQEGVL